MTTPEELRSLVAEKVMGGWHKGKITELWFDNDGCIVAEAWNPLESWADAGRVIERMADLGFTMTFIYGPGGDDVNFYHVEDGRYGFGKGKSAPRHISLAALRALGVEVE